MLPLALGLGMAALGAYRGKKQADRQAEVEADSRRMHAAQVRYSPWTGRQSFSPIQYASGGQMDSMIGGGLQGGVTGAALGQSFGAAKSAMDTSPLISKKEADFTGMQNSQLDPNLMQQQQGGFSPWSSLQMRRGYGSGLMNT